MKKWFTLTGIAAAVFGGVGILLGLRDKRQAGHREWSHYTDTV
ncbi:hypothetical protein [Brevibacterium litoralis]